MERDSGGVESLVGSCKGPVESSSLVNVSIHMCIVCNGSRTDQEGRSFSRFQNRIQLLAQIFARSRVYRRNCSIDLVLYFIQDSRGSAWKIRFSHELQTIEMKRKLLRNQASLYGTHPMSCRSKALQMNRHLGRGRPGAGASP